MPRTDQYKHFFSCFAATGLGSIPYQIWGCWWWLAPALGLAVGFAKELYDIGGSGFDWTDIFADVLGVGGAILLLGVTYG